jgi:AcrR family transcriptional regulator
MPKTQKKPDKTTRERLIDTAAELFSERGYQTTTLDDIARAVGIGPSAVYKHFGNKLDLYRAVLEQLATPFLQLLEEFEPDSNAVDFALRVFRYHIKQPALARLALQASLSGGEHRRLLIELWYRPYYEKSASRMRNSIALGDEATLIPSEFMAFNNIMLGYINLAALHAETLGVDPFAKRAVEDEAELLRRFATALMQHNEKPAQKKTKQPR